jgi:hypothetical protein
VVEKLWLKLLVWRLLKSKLFPRASLETHERWHWYIWYESIDNRKQTYLTKLTEWVFRVRFSINRVWLAFRSPTAVEIVKHIWRLCSNWRCFETKNDIACSKDWRRRYWYVCKRKGVLLQPVRKWRILGIDCDFNWELNQHIGQTRARYGSRWNFPIKYSVYTYV